MWWSLRDEKVQAEPLHCGPFVLGKGWGKGRIEPPPVPLLSLFNLERRPWEMLAPWEVVWVQGLMGILGIAEAYKIYPVAIPSVRKNLFPWTQREPHMA